MNLFKSIFLFVVSSLIFSTHSATINFLKDTTFTGAIKIVGPDSMKVKMCTLRFAGKWDNGYSAAKAFWKIIDGKIIVTAQAQINNNMADLVNARPFWITGNSLSDTIDFESGFNADHMNYNPQDLSTWTNNGLSSVRIINATMVTRATQNLPSVNKKAASGNFTHHGLLAFTRSDNGNEPARWIIKDNDQEFDGGITWNTQLHLICEKNLTYSGVYIYPDAQVTFGTYGAVGNLLIKDGPGALNLNGSPGHSPGSKIQVLKGTLNCNFDQGDTLGPQFTHHYQSLNNGQFLQLEINETGTCNFNAQTNGIWSVNNMGTLNINGIVDCKDTLNLSNTSKTTINLHETKPSITTHGIVNLNGNLTINNTIQNTKDSFTILISDKDISGSFAEISLPEGYTISYQPKSIILRKSTLRSNSRIYNYNKSISVNLINLKSSPGIRIEFNNSIKNKTVKISFLSISGKTLSSSHYFLTNSKLVIPLGATLRNQFIICKIDDRNNSFITPLLIP